MQVVTGWWKIGLSVLLGGCALAPVQQKPIEYEVQMTQFVAASYESVWQAAVDWFHVHRLPLVVADKQTGALSTRNQTYPNWEKRIDCGSDVNGRKASPVVKMTASLQPAGKDKTLVTFEVWAALADERRSISPVRSCVSKGILEKKFFDYLRRITKR